jgi:hypothetical protein
MKTIHVAGRRGPMLPPRRLLRTPVAKFSAHTIDRWMDRCIVQFEVKLPAAVPVYSLQETSYMPMPNAVYRSRQHMGLDVYH